MRAVATAAVTIALSLVAVGCGAKSSSAKPEVTVPARAATAGDDLLRLLPAAGGRVEHDEPIGVELVAQRAFEDVHAIAAGRVIAARQVRRERSAEDEHAHGSSRRRGARCRHTGRRVGDDRSRLAGHRYGLFALDPAIPQHHQREGEDEEEDEAALVHRIRSICGQGTGSYPPGWKG